MKNKNILLFICLIAGMTSAAQNKLHLEVVFAKQYKPTKLGMVSYYPYKSYTPKILEDSVTYLFDVDINIEFENYVLWIEHDNKKNVLSFFLKNGKSKIIIHKLTEFDSANDISYVNFPMIEEQKKFWKSTHDIHIANNKYYLLRSQVARTDTTKGNYLDSVNRIDRKNMLNKKWDYLQKNPNSWFALYYFKNDFLIQNRFSCDTLKMAFNSFTKKIKETVYGQEVANALNLLNSTQIGSLLTDAAFYTYEDKKMNLSDFRGKNYLLICFWGSWCKPCIHGIPTIKELYNKYNQMGLEILSIAINDQEDRWKIAMEKYNMPWLQTNCNEKYMPNEDVTKKYVIQFVPQYLLIDKQGKVVYNKIQVEKTSDDYAILKETLEKLLKE